MPQTGLLSNLVVLRHFLGGGVQDLGFTQRLMTVMRNHAAHSQQRASLQSLSPL